MEFKEKNIIKKILIITSVVFLTLSIFIAVLAMTLKQSEETSSPNLSVESKEESALESVSNVESIESIVIDTDSSAVESVEDTISNSYVSTEESAEIINHGWFINKYGYTYLYEDSGYEQFNYSNLTLNRYVDGLNELVNLIPETTKIYNIVVPVSSTFADIPREIYTEDNFYNKSQSAFVSTVASKTNERINNIPIVELIEEAYGGGEEVFFRTDKNWTSVGAYYAYRAFCEAEGISAYALNSFPKINAGDYLGRFYLATESVEMLENPDEFICYLPMSTVNTTLSVYDYGTVYTNYILCGNNATTNTLYDIYVGRTAGRYELNTTSGGGNLLILGDSSSYPMLSYLASHYSKIDLIDPQYLDTTLAEFLKGRDYNAVISMCYSTNATSGDYMPAFNTIIGVTENNG